MDLLLLQVGKLSRVVNPVNLLIRVRVHKGVKPILIVNKDRFRFGRLWPLPDKHLWLYGYRIIPLILF
jgi:hypothetical protein